MPRKALSIVVTLLISIGLFGCGGGDTPNPAGTFKRAVNAQYYKFGDKLAPIAGDITDTSSSASNAATLKRVGNDLHNLANGIRAIKGPDKFRDLRNRLGSEIDQAANIVSASNGKNPDAFSAQIRVVSMNLSNTINSINRTR